MSLEIGTKDSIEYKVEEKDLAKNLGISADDNFPPVFATARLTALMECSAAKAMKPLLGDGKLSVGVEVNLKHLAPTLTGDVVKSTATFVGMEGKLYKFEIEAERELAMYLLNQKRERLLELETTYKVSIEIKIAKA